MPTTTVIGERIKQRRLARNLTLREVGDKAKVSATHLSEIERGKTSPTVGALVRIARALGEEPSRLVAAEDAGPAVAVVRRGERRRWTSGGAAMQVLTRPVRPHELTVVEMEPGLEGAGSARGIAGTGEVLIIVLGGAVEVVLADGRQSLREGDVLHFSAREPYDLRAVDGVTARCLMVFSPPLVL
jgi:transcriptional regulator with XRE-family HTH domain